MSHVPLQQLIYDCYESDNCQLIERLSIEHGFDIDVETAVDHDAISIIELCLHKGQEIGNDLHVCDMSDDLIRLLIRLGKLLVHDLEEDVIQRVGLNK